MMNGATLWGYPVSRLRNEIDRAFDDVFGGAPLRRDPGVRAGLWGRSYPLVNVWEADEKLYAEAELPGLRLDDLEILIHGSQLTIQGERKEVDGEDVRYHRRERGTGSFCSKVDLPVEIDVDKVEATLENGVLTLEMPKAPSALPRKIEVQVKK
ncbi:MAG: Hsp20/alpha crystallin family protein [Gemmatimonadales bacterium]|jgi:HSP20 family protein